MPLYSIEAVAAAVALLPNTKMNGSKSKKEEKSFRLMEVNLQLFKGSKYVIYGI